MFARILATALLALGSVAATPSPASTRALDAPEDHGAWNPDLIAAQKLAREQKKDLLIEFTGSDWCAPCMRLWKETLSQEKFQTEAGKSYVLVVMDHPRDASKMTPELKKQSDEQHERYAVNRWPTFFLADAEGRPYARLDDYSTNGTEAWLAVFAKLQENKAKRDAAFEQAEKLEGPAKAKKIDEALSVCGEFCPTALYGKEIDAIAAADKDDTTGLVHRWVGKRAADQLEIDLPKLGQAGKWEELVARIDKFLAEGKPDAAVKQKALYWQGVGFGRLGKKDEAKKALESAVALGADTEYGKRAKQALGKP